MSDNVLTLRKLNVIKMPGFMPPGFSVEELKPQLNIIYGPNAAGKTTAARAISYLIWPQNAPDDITVQGEFSIDKDSWFAAIDAGKIIYQRNGTDTGRPPFPPAENRDRYYIALHELLQQETEDRSLAEIIIREAAGGYQIADTVKELGFKDKPSRKGKTTRVAGNKMKEYQRAVNEQEELLDEEQKLESLHQELTEIKEAQTKLEILKQVMEYKRVDREYNELKAELARFPEELSRLQGNEDGQIQELEQIINNYSNKNKNAEKRYERARQQLEEIDVPETGLSEKELTEIKVKRDRLKTLFEKIEQLRENKKEAESRREEEQKNFTDLIDIEKLSDIDGITYNQLSDFARRAEEINNRLDSFESLKVLLHSEKDNTGRENIINRGIRCLQKWLQIPAEEQLKKMNNIFLISNLVVFLMSLYLSFTVNPLFFILTMIPLAIFWYGRQQTGDSRQNKKEAQEEFKQLSLLQPSEWKTVAVRTRLQELYDQLSELRLARRRKQLWQDRSKQYQELREKQKELNRERRELINQFGVAPDTDSRTLFYITNHLSRWQDAYNRIQSLKSKLNEVTSRYQKTMSELSGMLADYGYSETDDIAEISGQITELESRNNRFQDAVRDRQLAESLQEEAEEKLQQAREKKGDIYNNIGLETDDRGKLRYLCNLYDDFTEIKEQLAKTEFHKQREREKLEQYSDFKQSLLDKNTLQLEKEIEQLKSKVSKSSDIYDEISSIQTKVATAKKGRDIEKALAAKERALDRLKKGLFQDYEQITGKVLADFVREVNTTNNRPRVLQTARQFFTTITRGYYELEVSNSVPPSFRAIETESGRGKSLEQLSSGTRIQLLLAVRMAFIEEEESGISVPLFMDETLANADDIRAEAIIKSVIELTRNGRQCMYFTAQKDEVNKWLSIAGEDSEVEINLIDLRSSKKLSRKINSPDIYQQAAEIMPPVREIAAAEGLSHEEYYQQLTVPPFNPRTGAGSIHLWYLIEDPELIEHLLKLGIEKWGQLKTLLATGRHGFIPEDKRDQLAEIKQMGCCVEEFVDCWQIGNGKPVDRAALIASQAVSDNFIDEVTELAESVNGDAEAIIEELRKGTVSRFLSKKIDELEQYFEDENYISSREPLSGEEIYAHMLSVVNIDDPQQMREKIRRFMQRIS